MSSKSTPRRPMTCLQKPSRRSAKVVMNAARYGERDDLYWPSNAQQGHYQEAITHTKTWVQFLTLYGNSLKTRPVTQLWP
jgi:hypothetical protein